MAAPVRRDSRHARNKRRKKNDYYAYEYSDIAWGEDIQQLLLQVLSSSRRAPLYLVFQSSEEKNNNKETKQQPKTDWLSSPSGEAQQQVGTMYFWLHT